MSRDCAALLILIHIGVEWTEQFCHLCFSIASFLHTLHPAQGQCKHDADMYNVPWLLVLCCLCLVCVCVSVQVWSSVRLYQRETNCLICLLSTTMPCSITHHSMPLSSHRVALQFSAHLIVESIQL